jgi:hypothetical protein
LGPLEGQARLQGTKTLDALLPSNVAGPDTALECVSFIIALANSYIRVPSGYRLSAGIWDNTAGQLDWLKASSAFALTGFVEGAPAATTERRYKILAHTDRGYTFLSTELTLVGAPTDPSFISNSVEVRLSWEKIEGILTYKVYRYNVVAATYEYIGVNDNGSTTFIDNNPSGRLTVVGYPASTDDRAKSYVATLADALAGVAVDGVAANWDTPFLNIPVPKNYDKSNTTGEQWLRLGQNMALDREVVDAVVNNGSPTLGSLTAAFTALDTGRTATVSDGTNSQTVTLTYVDATHVTMSANWAYANAVACSLYIVEGGDHGLLIDKIHMSYTPGATFAPNAADDRLDKGGQQPIAAPTSSSQGGVGSGGGGLDPGDGGVRCVWIGMPISLYLGRVLSSLPYLRVRVGDALFSGNLLPNFVGKTTRSWCRDLWLLRTENGVELYCSETHRVITSPTDRAGHAVRNLNAGDYVLTACGEAIVRSRLVFCGPLGIGGPVGTFSLYPAQIYVAGRRVQSPRWRRFFDWLFRRRRRALPVGILSHNQKADLGNSF